MEYLNGLIDLPWWGYVLVALGLTHITIASVTIFLHRHQAHRALDLHPLPSHFFRFWLWLTTGMITKQWAAIHRKHHARCETPEDPHSPQVLGLKKVLWQGAELYRAACKDQSIMDKFGHGTPDDWLENNIYTPRNGQGIFLMLAIDLILFGPAGLAIWAVQMVWIPFWAAGVVNGIGHYWGYRNFENEDAATNLVPWGILIGGEELHNNHHTFGTSAKLSYKWYEFDIGWMYIRMLEIVGLAKVRRVAPHLALGEGQPAAPLAADTLQTIITNRYAVAAQYARQLKSEYASEIERLLKSAKLPDFHGIHLPRKMKIWLKQDAKDTPECDRVALDTLLAHSDKLHTIYTMRQELTRLWERSSRSRDELLHDLQDWCARAEASGIRALREFSLGLRAAS
ncbi:DesA family fatty acid desaturase [Rivihabitans pingtungensis]|uniref:Stearoyl-CoA desaturase (Delta-9 desaturase) n=1 Tax=Rivihabitans pingtungensis TaxID=1054498 RepID=A0A318KIR5_9NEIS|nr:fatty acid desaturase [Rivihabitans pingtungensis]MCK6437322.1 fatty acid desaturase [Rivihabitans pingtungensis]PXX77741.1 stearoyl-CoA desaturase (delta-9 desaturase) [Rivihabitans pingtungensis]